MVDITKANTHTEGEMAGKQVLGATVEKIRKFFKYCYGANSDEFERSAHFAERYFYQALDRRFEDAGFLYCTMPDTENTEYTTQDIFTQGFFVGYLAAVVDTDRLHNEIELPANAE